MRIPGHRYYAAIASNDERAAVRDWNAGRYVHSDVSTPEDETADYTAIKFAVCLCTALAGASLFGYLVAGFVG